MHVFTTTILPLVTAVTASTTSAATDTAITIDVHVGQDNKPVFSPSTVTAAEGATINFHFYPANHSVAESLIRKPCRYTRDGIWSGYFPVSSGVSSSVFSVKLNDTNAHWLYSSQRDGAECQAGMVMVINPPDNPADTLDVYVEAARNAPDSTDGHAVMGGVVVASAPVSSSSSSSSSSSTQSSGTAGTTGTATSTAATTGTGTRTETGTTTGTNTTNTNTGTETGTAIATATGTATDTVATATTAATTGAPSGATSGATSGTATTGTAANPTGTGAASVQDYKNSLGVGAVALLLNMWHYL